MRSFDERKAEIFLRRDKLVKAKKRRKNTVLSLCVFVFVSAAVFSASYLPQFFAPKTNMEDGVDEEYATLGSIMVNIASVELENGVKYESPSDINRIVEAMSGNLFSESAVADSAASITEDNDAGTTDQTVNKHQNVIRFTLTDYKGNKTFFLLSDNTLINETQNVKTFLSEEKSKELRAALGSEES